MYHRSCTRNSTHRKSLVVAATQTRIKDLCCAAARAHGEDVQRFSGIIDLIFAKEVMQQ